MQAAQRGQKQSVSTEADANDPLKDQYGDSELIQSQQVTKRQWTRVEGLNSSLKDAQVGESETIFCFVTANAALHVPSCSALLQVLLRGRVATVRGKGKSAFLVLRQRTATAQVLSLHLCLDMAHVQLLTPCLCAQFAYVQHFHSKHSCSEVSPSLQTGLL